MRYVKGLDTIRAIAVLIVIVGHWGLPFKTNAIADDIISSVVQYGRFGVTIFFVLSGFLITSILLHEKVKHPDEKRLIIIKNFFARRVLRIFPVYFLFVLLYYFAGDPFVVSHIWYFITYTSNLYKDVPGNPLPHFWSLAVEEQFYLVWPWLIIFINKNSIKYVFISSIIIGIISQYVSLYVLHQTYGHYSINCFDSLGIGALYAYIRQYPEKCLKFERAFRVVLPLMLFIAWKFNAVTGLPLGVLYLRLVENCIALAMILFALNNHTPWVKKYILENPVLNFIGRISYGIYAFHATVGNNFDAFINYLLRRFPSMPRIITNGYVYYCTKLALLLFICWLSFRLMEQPIMRLKKRFEYMRG